MIFKNLDSFRAFIWCSCGGTNRKGYDTERISSLLSRQIFQEFHPLLAINIASNVTVNVKIKRGNLLKINDPSRDPRSRFHPRSSISLKRDIHLRSLSLTLNRTIMQPTLRDLYIQYLLVVPPSFSRKFISNSTELGLDLRSMSRSIDQVGVVKRVRRTEKSFGASVINGGGNF